VENHGSTSKSKEQRLSLCPVPEIWVRVSLAGEGDKAFHFSCKEKGLGDEV